MSDDAGPTDAGPRLRADAQRNRERLLIAAHAAFGAQGDAASLEAVARDAGVGIGTLYRHFPTREALVEAVFRHELADVCARAVELVTEHEPAEALRRWTDRYADFVATKRGMAETLRAVLTSGAIATGHTRQRITEALATLLAAGADAGTLRSDARADDVAATLVGIFLATTGTDDREQVGRMLDLLVDGLRAPRPGPPGP